MRHQRLRCSSRSSSGVCSSLGECWSSCLRWNSAAIELMRMKNICASCALTGCCQPRPAVTKYCAGVLCCCFLLLAALMISHSIFELTALVSRDVAAAPAVSISGCFSESGAARPFTDQDLQQGHPPRLLGARCSNGLLACWDEGFHHALPSFVLRLAELPMLHVGVSHHCRLALEAAFTSQLPRAKTSVTIFTVATAGRLHMLDGLCRSWGSVISLSVYAPVVAAGGGSVGSSAVANVTAKVQAAFER